jgi:hypothetical protein
MLTKWGGLMLGGREGMRDVGMPEVARVEVEGKMECGDRRLRDWENRC